MKFFNDDLSWTEEANKLEKEFRKALFPIFEKYKDVSPRDVAKIAFWTLVDLELSFVANWRSQYHKSKEK